PINIGSGLCIHSHSSRYNSLYKIYRWKRPKDTLLPWKKFLVRLYSAEDKNTSQSSVPKP
ncbi:hypothetical protein, partial [Candidatus Viridilinea mediisalina]|uniref:hypothetical protein n=1 Tax=Candidatus Viridilinea mediisalina TaxID=2024553 RepID=UPI001C2BF985